VLHIQTLSFDIHTQVDCIYIQNMNHSRRQRKTSERFKRNCVQQRGPLKQKISFVKFDNGSCAFCGVISLFERRSVRPDRKNYLVFLLQKKTDRNSRLLR
jgi:hypothetical protein